MLNDVAALYSENVVFFAGSVFVMALVVGSFLNVVIYRLPIILEREWRMQAAELVAPAAAQSVADADGTVARFTLSVPRSACPVCKARITAWQNIPVVSWLFLRGRCAVCNTRISARYPLVELLTALLSASVAWHFGYGINAACGILPDLGADCTYRHRHRPPTPARQYNPAFDVGRFGGSRLLSTGIREMLCLYHRKMPS